MASANTVKYFGYGSNLNAEDFTNWCNRMGFGGARLVPVSPAWLIDHKLQFHYFSSGRKGGAADVVEDAGMAVPGVLFEVPENTLEALDSKEGHPLFYQKEKVVVCTPYLELVEAITYKVAGNRRKEEHVKPTKEYVKLIEGGLRKFGLPTSMLSMSTTQFVQEENMKSVFVYGTLLRGQPLNYAMVSRNKPTSVKEASVKGALYDLEDFPGLRPGDYVVKGELYSYDTPMRPLLTELDAIEGHEGWGRGLYERVVVPVTVDGEIVWAWAYLLCSKEYDGTEGLITSGSWIERTS
eukprot:CAMPEP_0204829694 /NCGR_PEP_ID=MMETSP1346-20131115/7997_1 /ASSEMBLY_ACC=CAM_ASM_000771 /TAXON_ID=215587 /ORGANISM="Aplanochytrium stocchinoi, Strain GSBS06" /LENGTH=294 /DNA_ID=CAMNT_0051959701 /DNA_START=363 /DNA_END=1247 /DNA_ORIENTATION=+